MDALLPPTLIPSIFLAHLLPWYFFGVLSVQVCFYSQAALQDRLPTKVLVYVVYSLQLSQITLLTYEAFSCFVRSRTLSEFLEIRSTWFTMLVGVGLVTCCVRDFYAWRIFIISRTHVSVICVMTMSIISVALCLAAAVRYAAGTNMLSEFNWDFLLLVRMSLATGSVCDITIAGLTILYLKGHNPTEFRSQKTTDIVNRIVRLYIETGTLTACMGLLTFVVICIPNHPPVFQVFASTMSGVYATTFMALTNSRIKPAASCIIDDYHFWPEERRLGICGHGVGCGHLGCDPGEGGRCAQSVIMFAPPTASVLVSV